MRNPGRGFRSRKTAFGSNRQGVLCWLIQSIEEPNTPYCRTNSRHQKQRKEKQTSRRKILSGKTFKKAVPPSFRLTFFSVISPALLFPLRFPFSCPDFSSFRSMAFVGIFWKIHVFLFCRMGIFFFSLQHSPAFSPAAHCAS